jgi:hypothetical protein
MALSSPIERSGAARDQRAAIAAGRKTDAPALPRDAHLDPTIRPASS